MKSKHIAEKEKILTKMKKMEKDSWAVIRVPNGYLVEVWMHKAGQLAWKIYTQA